MPSPFLAPAAAITLAAGAALARPDTPLVRLSYATFDPLAGTPIILDPLKAPAAGRVFLVQFASTPTESDRAALGAIGATVQRFLTDNTHIVTLDPGAVPTARSLAGVRWVGPYHPEYRLSEVLRELAVAGTEGPPLRCSIEAFERGAPAQSRIADHIRAAGGTVHLITPEGFRMEATLTRDQLVGAARLDDVAYIDPVGAPGADMDIVRQLVGAAPVLSNAGFMGQGVRGSVLDLGLDLAHPDFQNPAPAIQCGPVSSSDHGTSIFGIIFGSGAGNPLATGLLPAREQGVFCVYTALSTFGGGTSAYDAARDLIDPVGPYRCVFQARAVGSAQISTYTTISAETDDVFFLYDLLISQSQGYETGSNNCRPQAWAKNIISVGGVLHQNTLARADDTGGLASMAADGRVKPDLAVVRDGVLTTTIGGYTTTFGGTSASTAAIAGCAGLVFQMWHAGVWPGFGGGSQGPTVFDDRPHHSMVRALLINAAYQYDWTQGGANGNITRGAQGWGMPDLATLYNARNSTFLVNETDPIQHLQTRSYALTVAPNQPILAATMVYLDPKGTPGAAQARVNDLTLKVTAPDQTVYWGNAGLRNGIWSTPGGLADTVSTVENVFIQNPAPGQWTVAVEGKQVVQDARLESPELDADFALVVRGVTFPCYANCDNSTIPPVLNIQDFACFINSFAAGNAYANCDGSTIAPVLNIQDFGCFLNRFAAGCP